MTDNVEPQPSSPASEDIGQPTLWVSHCPDYGLYHIHREVEGDDPDDVKLTREELAALVDGLIKVGKIAQAQEMALTCAWARLFAHKVVLFYTSGTFRIFDPPRPTDDEKEEREEMKGFQAQWQAEHPEGTILPVVEPYRK
jgi:hypothetical protein